MREEHNTSTKFIQSYLYTKKYGNFFISTCYRKSSAFLDPAPWYYETFAWRLDKNNHRTSWVVEFAGNNDKEWALQKHIEICEQLDLKGEYKYEETF